MACLAKKVSFTKPLWRGSEDVAASRSPRCQFQRFKSLHDDRRNADLSISSLLKGTECWDDSANGIWIILRSCEYPAVTNGGETHVLLCRRRRGSTCRHSQSVNPDSYDECRVFNLCKRFFRCIRRYMQSLITNGRL